MSRAPRISAAYACLLATLLALGMAASTPASSWAAHGDQHSPFEEQVQRDSERQSERPSERPAEDMGEGIPPVLVDGTEKLNPYLHEPIDPTGIEITTVTPADRFIRATTPLLAGLTLGALGLLVLAISQAVRKRSAGEIRLGE